jgi:aryl-alcohol dehydrogenase-like predicted oxidoreductase
MVRAIGASNFDAAEIEEADTTARERGLTPFCAVQNEYSLLSREAEEDALPACQRLGMGFVPFFPLASGLLTGKYRPGEPGPEGARLSGRDQIATDAQFALIAALQQYADARGVSLLDVAIGALLANEIVSSVIAGATRPEQVRANATAARWRPDAQDVAELRELLATQPI